MNKEFLFELLRTGSVSGNEAELEKKVKQLATLEIEILSLIYKLEDPKLQAIVQMRYLDEMRWGDIARQLILSKPYIYQVHREALEKIDLFLKEHSVS